MAAARNVCQAVSSGPLCPAWLSPLAAGPTRGAGLLALEPKQYLGRGGQAGTSGLRLGGGGTPCPREAQRHALGAIWSSSRPGAGAWALAWVREGRLCVRAWVCPRSAVSWVGALLAAGLEVIVRRPSPRVFTGNPISLEELHIKACPRLMSRGLGGQQAGGSVPVCDLWSPWHWVPGEDCDRSSLWRSGVLCFPEAWGH